MVYNSMQGADGPGGIGANAWHYWTLLYGPSSQDLWAAISTLGLWMDNTYPPWVAYIAIISSHLIGL